MSVKVEGIELQIKSDSTRAAASLYGLSDALKTVKGATKNAAGLKNIADGLASLNQVLASTDFKALERFADVLSKIREAKGVGNISIRMQALTKDQKELLEKVNDNAAESSTAAAKIDPAEYRAAEQTASSAAEATEKAKKSFYDFSNAIKSLSRPLKEKLDGIAASFKRILFYRVIRTVIKEITQAFKEGTNNAYQYSKAIGGPFAESMDKIATSLLFMKNGLGAALAPIINALTPVITSLADAVAYLGNTIAGFIATLTHQETYIKAIKNMTAYADATKGAAKAQRQLLGFDELNRLTQGGSGSGSSTNYNNMFETVSTDSFLKDFGQSILELPKIISEKFQTALHTISEKIQQIDWSKLPHDVAAKIKEFFGNFDWAGNFAAIGELIGSALGSAVKFGGEIIGRVRDYFKEYIDKELSGLDEDASVLEKGKAIVTGIFNGIKEKMASVYEWIKTNIVTPFIQSLKSGFEAVMGSDNSWTDVFSTISNAFGTVIGWMKDAWEELKQALAKKPLEVVVNMVGSFYNKFLDLLQLLGIDVSKYRYNYSSNEGGNGSGGTFKSNGSKRTTPISGGPSYNVAASGGYFSSGTMFLAGESGPELVGQVGNRTGVINSDQFGAMIGIAADNIINAILSSGQGVAEAAREGGNTYLDGTLLTRKLHPLMEKESKRIGPSAISVV